ncbi:MAG: hypothetical protein V4519_02910 [Patescibacteria group bacterium]
MNLKITIENKKRSFKTFEDEDDDGTYKYPLRGVTFPTNYGFIEGYRGEDGDELDVFVGSGDLYASFQVWRYDVPLETKFCMNITQKEWDEILAEYKPVIKTQTVYKTKEDFEKAVEGFKV